MPKYRKKPIVVELVIWNGDNVEELYSFAGMNVSIIPSPYTVQLFVYKSKAWCSVEPGGAIVKEPDGVGFYPLTEAVLKESFEQICDNCGGVISDDAPHFVINQGICQSSED